MKEIGSFITKYWKHPVAIGLYIAVAVWLIYKYGMKQGSPEAAPLPNETDWGAALTTQQAIDVRKLTERLHTDMDSYMISAGFATRDLEAYKQLLNIPEKEFVAVANDFNDLYYTEKEGNLYQWIDEESFTYTWGASGDIRATILNKMEEYNLKTLK